MIFKYISKIYGRNFKIGFFSHLLKNCPFFSHFGWFVWRHNYSIFLKLEIFYPHIYLKIRLRKRKWILIYANTFFSIKSQLGLISPIVPKGLNWLLAGLTAYLQMWRNLCSCRIYRHLSDMLIRPISANKMTNQKVKCNNVILPPPIFWTYYLCFLLSQLLSCYSVGKWGG